MMNFLHKNFSKFYKGFKENENYKSINFITFNLDQFTESVLEDWHGDKFMLSHLFGVVQDGSKLLFEISVYHNKRFTKNGVSYLPLKTRIAITDKGDLVTYTSDTTKTGGQTFTGDEYIDTYQTVYQTTKIGEIETFKDFMNDEDITSQQIEAIAVEVAQLVSDFHDSEKFYV